MTDFLPFLLYCPYTLLFGERFGFIEAMSASERPNTAHATDLDQNCVGNRPVYPLHFIEVKLQGKPRSRDKTSDRY